jgi:hypothetical protein
MEKSKFFERIVERMFSEHRVLTTKEFNNRGALRFKFGKEESKELKNDLESLGMITIFGKKNSKIAPSTSLNNTDDLGFMLKFQNKIDETKRIGLKGRR